jgi:hypothetical protein
LISSEEHASFSMECQLNINTIITTAKIKHKEEKVYHSSSTGRTLNPVRTCTHQLEVAASRWSVPPCSVRNATTQRDRPSNSLSSRPCATMLRQARGSSPRWWWGCRGGAPVVGCEGGAPVERGGSGALGRSRRWVVRAGGARERAKPVAHQSAAAETEGRTTAETRSSSSSYTTTCRSWWQAPAASGVRRHKSRQGRAQDFNNGYFKVTKKCKK